MKHGVFLRLGWYLLCCALVIKVFVFSDFDNRDPSIGVNLVGPQALNIPNCNPQPKYV